MDDFTGTGPTCPPWACGTNSATVGDGVVFDSLNGSRNEEGANGIKIMQATLPGINGRPVRLHVEGDQLFATELDPATDGSYRTYSGQGLVGLTLLVTSHLPSDASAMVQHELRFERVIDSPNMSALTYWAYWSNDWAAQMEVVPFYEILTRRLDQDCPPVPICTQNVASTDLEAPGKSRWTPVEHSALVFEGDHYSDKHDVTDVPAPTTWFNLACAGTAAAKMHLLRHSNAGAYSSGLRSYATTSDERTAMLRMLTADYCGTGTSFTVDGQPLRYVDAKHWYQYIGTPTIDAAGNVNSVGSIEALWTATGAICLDAPRRAAAMTTPVSRADIDSDCTSHGRPVLPTCTGSDGKLSAALLPWEAHAHVMSANVP